MTWLPGAFFFAIVGFCVALASTVLIAAVVAWWLKDVACGLLDRRRGAAAIRHRSPTIPAAQKPMQPLPHRLTEDRIAAELRRIAEEIRAELGPDFTRILGLFADEPNTTDR